MKLQGNVAPQKNPIGKSGHNDKSPIKGTIKQKLRLKMKMATIFIVDDEVILHKLYKDVFAIKGHQVVADAYDGDEAVRKYAELDPKPDVIILDHRMPNKDGLDVMKEILGMNSDAKIVFISADANVKDVALKNGASSFGLKPVTIRHMLELIDIAMSK